MAESEFERNLYALRQGKLGQIAEIGVGAGLSVGAATYPNSYEATHTVPELRAAYEGLTAEELEGTVEAPAAKIEVSLAGRVMAIRVQGKAGFAQLQQGGMRFQIYVRRDDVGESLFGLYKLLDLGDHVGVRGYLFRTRTGELTVHVKQIEAEGHGGKPALTFLAKAMLALPDKYHGLEDTELRYRQRYVDLIVNSGAAPKVEGEEPGLNVREVFEKRAKVLRALRKFFDARGYIEVETPMLVPIAGGAAARPFLTHHNALDYDLSLRIAPELYLKRLVVGGMDRVYEINRNFRNEGIDTSHNPEFTMLEFYQAYSNYWDLMDLTEEIVRFVAMKVNGGLVVSFDGNEIDLGTWRRLTMLEAIIEHWPEEFKNPLELSDFLPENFLQRFTFILNSTEVTNLKKKLEEQASKYKEFSRKTLVPVDVKTFTQLSAQERIAQAKGRAEGLISQNAESPEYKDFGLAMKKLGQIGAIEYAVESVRCGRPLGKSIASIFEAVAEECLIHPTIIYDFPLAVSPLSKQKADEPDWVERFEFYIGGFEVGNAFSELNDPEEQRRRFEMQVAERERGDDEAHPIDEDYVRALGYGLPPTAGEGIGIDRLTMVLTGAKSIRDVILFPLMRPVKAQVAGAEDGVASTS